MRAPVNSAARVRAAPARSGSDPQANTAARSGVAPSRAASAGPTARLSGGDQQVGVVTQAVPHPHLAHALHPDLLWTPTPPGASACLVQTGPQRGVKRRRRGIALGITRLRTYGRVHAATEHLGELRATGHAHQSVKQEIRANLVAAMRSGSPRFEGILGFDETVLPAVERALLAGHDVVLLGERGQGKTRLIRTVVSLLDEWSPVVDGCEVNDHPRGAGLRALPGLHAELGDDLPVGWRHRIERYGEKLATPDTSVGDLIGDIDPIRVARGPDAR